MSGTEANDDPAYIADETSYLAHVRNIQGQSWPPGVPRKPVYPLGERPITEYLREWARRTPTKAAINFYGRETSYAELDRLSSREESLRDFRYTGTDSGVTIGLRFDAPCEGITTDNAIEQLVIARVRFEQIEQDVGKLAGG